MMRDEVATLLLHAFDCVVQKEIYQDGVDAGNMVLVDAVLFRAFLRGELVLVYFLGVVAAMRGFAPKVLGFHFRVLFLDFTLDELDAPDAGGAEFGFPVGATRHRFEVTDVALQRWRVAEAAEFVEHLGDAIIYIY